MSEPSPRDLEKLLGVLETQEASSMTAPAGAYSTPSSHPYPPPQPSLDPFPCYPAQAPSQASACLQTVQSYANEAMSPAPSASPSATQPGLQTPSGQVSMAAFQTPPSIIDL